MQDLIGPQLAYSEELHSKKYRLKGETFRDAMTRIATSLKDDPEHYHRFRDVLLHMRFMPAGRVQSAMGAPKQVTAYNCFVGGTIEDSFVDGEGSIMARATEGATTMRMGGGLGNDFSTLRPRGALIEKLQSTSTGPIAFMGIFNSVGDCTSSTGERRGAQMGVLRIDHPDIFEFINAKHDQETLKRFNISVGVTDEFMEHLASGRPFPLQFGGRVYKHVDPHQLWETFMQSTWDWAEPGVLYLDTINRMNNLWYCERIAATNPCGEQPLPPYGACLLGSFNLVKYLRRDLGGCYFAWDDFQADIYPVVRAMDNIIDRTIYPLPQQAAEARNKRRMGLGVTAFANALEALGFPYGSRAFLDFEDKVLAFLTRHAYIASTELAVEKGSFPLFDADLYCKGEFFKTLDSDVQELIRRRGLRNSHLISYAPTGTISMTADYVSSSIEPVYQWRMKRPAEMPGGIVMVDEYDYGFRELKVRGKRAANGEVTAQEHIDVLVRAQRHSDSAVSKTVNCDGSMPWADFKGLYISAYEGGAKGCTTFNVSGKRFGLYKAEVESDDLAFPNAPSPMKDIACTFDPQTGRRTCE